MNEGVISSYENYFSGSGLPPDLAAEMAMTTSIHASLEVDYLHKEVSSQQMQQQNSRRFHTNHSSTFTNSFVTPGEVTMQTVNNATQINYVCNNNGSVSNASHSVPANVFTQIPFVQIHTTDVQPQSAFNSTRFRRNATNNHEIKAEPIKSENAEGAKDRINGTPTPPATSTVVQQRTDSSTSANSTQNENITCTNQRDLDLDVNDKQIVTDVRNCDNMSACASEGSAFVFPNIHRCQYCAFISLNENSLQLHLEAMHQANFNVCENALKRNSMHCPGCDNIFYTFTSVEVHLREDHLMCEQDVGVLMHAIKTKSQINENSTPSNDNVKTTEPDQPIENSMPGTQRRSRIYLKNVECLREPHRDPIEQQDNLITESLFHFENDDCNTLVNIGSISMEDQELIGMLTSDETTFNNNNKNDNSIDNIVNETITPTIELNKSTQPKQKISIKSVDVLCEPALIRRDYDMQTFGDFMNVCNDLNLHVTSNNQNSNNNETNNCEIDSASSAAANGQYQLLDNASNVRITSFEQDYEKPRKPKIYIKNVDILKEPMTFSNTLNASNISDSSLNNIMNFNFMPQTLTQNGSNYMDTHLESLNATVPTFNGGVGVGMSLLPLGTISDQYLFDSGAGNFLSNSTTPTTDNYAYVNETNADEFLMDTNRFTDAITPIITEPTPPPQSSALPTLPLPTSGISNIGNCNMNNETPSAPLSNVQKQKIFIKNVDILKEPQFQQEPRGLLHLRTVDELNLMNRKEVENLIAPNLESSQQTNMIEDELNDNFQQLNTTNAESLTTNDSCNDNNVAEQISYECENFKLNEFTNTPNSWHDDYDLGDDIRDIITSTMAPSLSTAGVAASATQKIIHDLDTPQMSLISIPDIEELTDARVQIGIATESESNAVEAPVAGTPHQQDNTNFIFDCEQVATDIPIQETTLCSTENANNCVILNAAADLNDSQKDHSAASITVNQLENSPQEVLKQERLNQTTPPSEPIITNTNFDNLPPLTPMTTASTTFATMKNTVDVVSISVAPSGLPVPPLVPMLQPLPIQLPKNVAVTNSVSTPTAPPVERGRIYVANNLLQAPTDNSSSSTTLQISAPTTAPPKSVDATATKTSKEQTKTPIAVTVMGGTSVRGRPFGANRTDFTKQRKQVSGNNNIAGVYLKCTVAGCAFRFKKSTTIDYHIKCHTSESSPQSMACPECKGPFTNWNSLHTHLWRTHKIDMELYSCQLCTFKTPIYSRLLNTHSKIHYDERNYKCDQCEKAFKNTKQLKNHRRWHRNHNKSTTARKESPKTDETSTATLEKEQNNKDPTTTASSQITTNTTITTIVPLSAPARSFHRCKDCDAVFSHQKTLREHLCKNAAAAAQCEVCDRTLTSRSSLKLHMQSHEPSRRFKCNTCDYATSDHNAFRRHKMTHDSNAKMYACIHCDYKSIQSVAYQKHVQQKHPQFADSIVYKCKICPYATINKALYDLHKIKHENSNTKNEAIAAPVLTTTENITRETETNCNNKNAQTPTPQPVVQKTTKIKVKSHLLLTTPVVDSMMEFNDLCFEAITIPV